MQSLVNSQQPMLPVQTAVGPARNDDVLLRLHANIRNEKQKSLKHREW